MLHRGTDPDAVYKADGKPCNTAAFGFANFLDGYLFPILEMVEPVQIIAAWDSGNDLRRAWYSGYKKKRSEKETDPVEQEQYENMFKLIKNLLASIGATQVAAKMTEADDLIALLVRSIPGPKVVYTVDADLGELASEDCSVFLRCELMEGDHKGVPLSLTTLNKSMVGDTSDEYPGIKGFGPKAWWWFMENFELDGMFQLQNCVATKDYQVLQDAIDGSDPKIAKGLQKVMDAKEDWELMYKLASLHPDKCYRTQKQKVVRPEWFRRVPNIERLKLTLEKGGCFDLYSRFEDYMPDQSLVTAKNLSVMLPFFLEHCNDGPLVSFDYETTDTLCHAPFQEAQSKQAGNYVDVLSSAINGCSFTFGNNLQYTLYVCIDHAETECVSKDVLREMIKACEPKKLIAHNASFEVNVSANDLDLHVESPIDTFILHTYCDEDGLHGLKHLALKYLGYKQTSYKDTLEAAGVDNMQQLTGEQVEQYGCDDAIVTAGLGIIFGLSTLCEGTWEQIQRNEFSVVHALGDAFRAGVNVDQVYLAGLAIEDDAVIASGMERIRELLSENCSSVADNAGQEYLEDYIPFLKSKMKQDGKDKEEIESKCGQFKDAFLMASKYIPLQEIKKEVKFVPTKLQIRKVSEKLGFGVEFPEPTVSGITKWLVAVGDEQCYEEVHAGDSNQIEGLNEYIQANGGDQVNRDKNEFKVLLAESGSQIRKRSGQDYDEFFKFCVEVLSRDVKSETVGDELNFDSPVQNAALFYGKLNLPIRVRTKYNPKGTRAVLGFQPSPATDDKALETAVAEDCDGRGWVKEVLTTMRDVKAARTRGKLYYKPYPLWVHPIDGMIHHQIVNCGTVTHRPTGKAPNFLQITKKDGGRIRQSVRGFKEDHIIVSPDFSGQELRILASECEDEVLLDAYLGAERKDIHSITAAGIAPITLARHMPDALENFVVSQTGLTYEDYIMALNGDDKALAKMMKDIRKDAKGVNFLINYLGGANTLSRNLGIKKDLAQQFMDNTFKRYPGIKPWQDSIMRFARSHGYSQTAYGTRRHISSDICSGDKFVAARSERQAVNFVIQGCAAQILKIVLRTMHERKLMQRTGSVMIAPVYDEITASVPISAAQDYIAEITEIMTVTPPGHRVPMLPEIDVGPTWGQLIELGAHPSTDKIEEALDKCKTL